MDDWTWDSPELKTRTSPDKQKRARADVENGKIELKIGEAGPDHPVDIMVHFTEMIPEPQNGQWVMRWTGNDEFAFEHPGLGTKTWKIEGGAQMNVTTKVNWVTPGKQK